MQFLRNIQFVSKLFSDKGDERFVSFVDDLLLFVVKDLNPIFLTGILRPANILSF